MYRMYDNTKKNTLDNCFMFFGWQNIWARSDIFDCVKQKKNIIFHSINILKLFFIIIYGVASVKIGHWRTHHDPSYIYVKLYDDMMWKD